MAMYINHSCDPNCETEEDEQGKVWIMSMRDIAAGEELTYDYLLYEGDGDAPCSCGSEMCRGSFYSPKERARRMRAAAKRKRR
jgi:SET domain-containing protein